MVERLPSPRDSLAPLARAFACRVRRANLYDDGEHYTAQITCKPSRVRIEAFASETHVLLGVRGIRQALVFALNRGSIWRDRAKCIATIGRTRVLTYPAYSDIEGFDAGRVLAWANDPRHGELIAALDLRRRDYVHISSNGLAARIGLRRATADLIERLSAFAVALPADAPEDVLEGVAALPVALQPLAVFFAPWATGDDAQRDDLIAEASMRHLRSLRRAVEPLLPAIDAYLDECGPTALSPAAIRLSQLGELVAELRAHEA